VKQTAGIYEVTDGALMSGEDECITLRQCRVIIEPLNDAHVERLEQRANAAFTCMDRAANRLMKWVVVAFALYFACILVHAFTSGAFAAAVK